MVKVYRNQRQAKEAAAELVGWTRPRPSLVYEPEHERAGRKGYVWTVRCEEGYMREDGFIQ
jgi:flagellar basal body rod protein FlgC